MPRGKYVQVKTCSTTTRMRRACPLQQSCIKKNPEEQSVITTYYDSPLVLASGIAFLTRCFCCRQIAQTAQLLSAISLADNACQPSMASKTSTTHASAIMTSSNFRTIPCAQMQHDNFQHGAPISRTIAEQQHRNVQMRAQECSLGQQRLAPLLMRVIAHECVLGFQHAMH